MRPLASPAWELSLAADWRRHLGPSRYFFTTFNRKGLESLVYTASQEISDHMPLPYNLHIHGPAVGLRRSRHHRLSDYPEMVERYARFAGWLRAVGAMPVLVGWLAPLLSTRGVNSPRCRVDLWRLSARYPSPGRLLRAYLATRARAAQILAPYGRRPSRAALAAALSCGPRRTGKAAVMVAAHQICGPLYGDYRSARAGLITMSRSTNTKTDNTDGVSAILANKPAAVVHGLTVTSIVLLSPPGHARKKGWLVLGPGGRSYHALAHVSTTDAAREALDAWKRRMETEREMHLPDPCRVTLLVTRQDSWAAGNCHAGTEAFLRRHGWQDRWYILARQLLETSEPLAYNAVRRAATTLQM